MLASAIVFGILAFWLRKQVVAVDLPIVDLGYARYRAGGLNVCSHKSPCLDGAGALNASFT